jgi:hypothetical protein
MQTGERYCETDGKAQKLRHFHRPSKQLIETFAARIFEHERRVPTTLDKGQGANRPG